MFGNSSKFIELEFPSKTGRFIWELDFTLCIAFCCFFSEFFHKENSQRINRVSFTKDLLVYIGTICLLLFLIIDDNVIDLIDAIILTALFPLYIMLNAFIHQTKWFKDAEMESGNDNDSADDSILPYFADIPKREEREMESQSFVRRHISERGHDSEGFNTIKPFESKELQDEEESATLSQTNSLDSSFENNEPHTDHSTQKEPRTCSTSLTGLIALSSIPFTRLFEKTIPVDKPIHAFFISMVYVFLFTQYTLFCVDVISDYFGVPVSFLGLIFSAWGNNIGDLATALISSKNQMASQAASSLLGSQIINIQLCLAFPWLIKNIFVAPVKFIDPSITTSIEIIIGSLLLLYAILWLGQMRLSCVNGSFILLIYLVYVLWEILQTKKQS